MKVKSESEVAQSCPTFSDPVDCSLPGSSIHGIFQARVLEWGAIAFSGAMHHRVRNLQLSNGLMKFSRQCIHETCKTSWALDGTIYLKRKWNFLTLQLVWSPPILLLKEKTRAYLCQLIEIIIQIFCDRNRDLFPIFLIWKRVCQIFLYNFPCCFIDSYRANKLTNHNNILIDNACKLDLVRFYSITWSTEYIFLPAIFKVTPVEVYRIVSGQLIKNDLCFLLKWLPRKEILFCLTFR